MHNIETTANIVHCGECLYYPVGFCCDRKHMCPLIITIEGEDYYKIPMDNWFCANGGYNNSNYKTKACDIVRCKDCIYNPSITEGLNKYTCPLVIPGYEHYYSTPKDDWFCANGESEK